MRHMGVKYLINCVATLATPESHDFGTTTLKITYDLKMNQAKTG